MARSRAIAPGVSFRIVVPGSDLAAALDEGAVDLALGAFGKVPPRTILEPLYREELVWIASVHNPVARPPVSLAQIATHPRLAIAVGKSFDGASAILRSEEHTSELKSLMRISYAVFCLKTKNK